ncbi:hypothetical protein [Aurantibacillus circumpalustris]|uniref:hypothetical protein n=1 Tax=Aurantibacillus circumpalustris TaxID=3036359 RepID=UPI00295B42EF|nr:hypothetical protein [Aurantibacillus circumpalustris]
MIYATLTIIHVIFTGVALLSGILAMVASPKGNKLHKNSGLVYLYSFTGILVTAIIMNCIKYKDLFLGFTILNSYLLFMGFWILKNKHSKANWTVWATLTILFCGGLLLLAGALRIDDDFYEHGYKWSIVRAFFAGLIFYFTIKDFRYLRNKGQDKKSWLYNHMEKMLFTYISLISGIALRLSDLLPYKDIKWLSWIVPYLICLPLIAYWVGKYKVNKVKSLLESETINNN